MADATTAAKARVDRALALLERKVQDLKARPGSAPPLDDDDLFAPDPAGSAGQTRIDALEAAGREASAALARAVDRIRFVLAETPEDQADADTPHSADADRDAG